MYYHIRIPHQGFLRFDAKKDALTFTDNFYLMKQFYYESEVKKFIDEVLDGVTYELWGVEPVIEKKTGGV